jgi:hypothetical protein
MREVLSNRSARRRAARFSAVTAILSSAAAAAAADTLIQSFETGGFDEPGDTAVVTTTPLQTQGVTNGSFSLRVDTNNMPESTPSSWWTDPGHIIVPNAADIFSNSVLKFDVTTNTGAQFVPIFLTDTGATYYQAPNGFSVGASVNPQTVSFNYTGLGIQPDATSVRIRLQLSNGGPVSFFLDNVRVGPAAIVLGDSAEWKTNGGGAWVDGVNWNTGVPPGALGSTVTFGTFGGTITTPDQIVVPLDQPANPANLVFDKGGGGYRITGGSAIALTANVQVISGNHVISSPLNASNGSIFDIAANSSITIDNLGVGGFGLVEKTGAGTMTADKIQNTNLLVSGGVVNLKPGNAQNNGFIYGLDVFNGSVFNMNGARLRVNSLSSNETPGTVNLGTGGILNLGIFGGVSYFGTITGDGSLIVGGTIVDDTAPAQTVTLGGINSYTGTTEVRNGNTVTAFAAANLGDDSAGNGVILDEGTFEATASFGMNRKITIGAAGGTVNTGSFDLAVGQIESGALTKVGAGVLITERLSGVTTATISAGTLRLGGASNDASKVQSLSIAGGAALDVGGDAIVIDYTGASPFTTAQGQIVSGFAGGSWNGAGINSSTAAAVSGGAVGYAEASSLFSSFPASYLGQAVDADSVIVAYTLAGDANLDRTVDIGDFALLAANFNTPAAWNDGDFNYDGVADIGDFALLASKFNQSVAVARAAVPEPASAILALAALGFMRRRLVR